MEMQRYLFKCENCGINFYLGGDGVETKYAVHHTVKNDGRSVWLTYYDCPVCDKRHYVQIDDTRSIKMKREVEKMFVKLSKKRLDYRDIPKQQNDKFKKLNRSLEDYRLELKKEFDSCIMTNDDNEDYEVHFSM